MLREVGGDAEGDGGGDFVGVVVYPLCICGVGDEAAFDEDGGGACVFEYVEVCAFDGLGGATGELWAEAQGDLFCELFAVF